MTRTRTTTNSIAAGRLLVGGFLVAVGGYRMSHGGPCTVGEALLGLLAALVGAVLILTTLVLLLRQRRARRR